MTLGSLVVLLIIYRRMHRSCVFTHGNERAIVLKLKVKMKKKCNKHVIKIMTRVLRIRVDLSMFTKKQLNGRTATSAGQVYMSCHSAFFKLAICLASINFGANANSAANVLEKIKLNYASLRSDLIQYILLFSLEACHKDFLVSFPRSFV